MTAADEGTGGDRLMLALYQPDIAQNAGTLMRTCACLGVTAALIEPAGFATSDRHFRRSGMDYLDRLTIERFSSYEVFSAWRKTTDPERRLVLLSTSADLVYGEAHYAPDDILMVGRETAGVPPAVHRDADLRVRIPMRSGFRSLNVAVAAAMVLGEAIMQVNAR